MKSNRLLGALLSVGLGLAAVTHPSEVLAQRGQAKKAPAGATADAPMTKKAISLPLAGIAWGQSPKQVAERSTR